MDDVERDSSITVNIGFGNVTFFKEDRATFARAIVDIDMARDVVGDLEGVPDLRDHIEIAFTILASPEADTITDVIERSRLRIAGMLRAAAAHFEAETAEGMLYPEG